MIYKVELLLHNIRSVYNVASIFRTAECLGVSKIWLSGYTPAPVDRFGRKRNDFNKVALGTELEIDWEQIQDVNSLLRTKKDLDFTVVGLEQADNSIFLENYSITSSILLIPGTETTGLEVEIQNQCDALVEIKQIGIKESLNIQSATSIALWKLLID